MEEMERLGFADAKEKIGEHLKTALGIEEFEITFAKQDDDLWKVNVEFNEKIGTFEWPTTAFFVIDATTGEVREFRKGYLGRF